MTPTDQPFSLTAVQRVLSAADAPTRRYLLIHRLSGQRHSSTRPSDAGRRRVAAFGHRRRELRRHARLRKLR
jgi:hypothetical protein